MLDLTTELVIGLDERLDKLMEATIEDHIDAMFLQPHAQLFGLLMAIMADAVFVRDIAKAIHDLGIAKNHRSWHAVIENEEFSDAFRIDISLIQPVIGTMG